MVLEFTSFVQGPDAEPRQFAKTVFTGMPLQKVKKKQGNVTASSSDLKIQHFFTRRK